MTNKRPVSSFRDHLAAYRSRSCLLKVTIVNAAAGDNYANIGRFAATLSAGAGYTWSVPTYTASNLIQRPIFETSRLDWVPSGTNFTIGTGGAAEASGSYYVRGKSCVWSAKLVLGSSGQSVGGNISLASLPFTEISGVKLPNPVTLGDSGIAAYEGALDTYTSGDVKQILVKKTDGTYETLVPTTATIPMSWGAADSIKIGEGAFSLV